MERMTWVAVWFGWVGLSVLWTAQDVWRHPNTDMPIMNWVWPLVALYFGPAGALLYLWLSNRGHGAHRVHSHPALPASPGVRTESGGHHHPVHAVMSQEASAELSPHHSAGAHWATHAGEHHSSPSQGIPGMADPLWVRSARSATHCMAGCALGDITAMTLVEGAGWLPFGGVVLSEVLLGAVLAFIFGLLVFQAFPVMAERHVGFGGALRVAFKADVVTISAYLAGQIPALYLFRYLATPAAGGMALSAGVAAVGLATMALVMQGSMAVGFLTTYPLNYWLVASGVKHGM